MRFFTVRPSSHYIRSTFLLASLLSAGFAMNGGVAWADEASDWTAVIALRQQIGDKTFREQPQVAVDQLKQFAASRQLHPILAAEVTLQIADITRKQLNDPQGALQMLDDALQQVDAHPDSTMPVKVMYLRGKADALLAQNQAGAAQKLLQDNFKSIEAAVQNGHPHLVQSASQTLQTLCNAQDAVRPAEAKADENIAVLEYALTQWPVYLDPRQQKSLDWQDGWMYESLVKRLAAQGKTDEALQWGRLYFAEAPFDGQAIENAIKPLSGVWATSGDLAKVRAFAVAQTAISEADKATTANPLANVSTPDLGAQGAAIELKKLRQLQKMGPWRDRVTPIITLEIATGQWHEAMEDAMKLIVEDASAPDGPQQVARVFKAHDGSIVRANQFLAYLDGKAANPVPTFLAEAAAGATP